MTTIEVILNFAVGILSGLISGIVVALWLENNAKRDGHIEAFFNITGYTTMQTSFINSLLDLLGIPLIQDWNKEWDWERVKNWILKMDITLNQAEDIYKLVNYYRISVSEQKNKLLSNPYTYDYKYGAEDAEAFLIRLDRYIRYLDSCRHAEKQSLSSLRKEVLALLNTD